MALTDSKNMVSVWDFDGTWTDVGKEAETYLAAYHELLSQERSASEPYGIGIPLETLHLLLDQARNEVLDNPEAHGWYHDGVIVAPACADPYLLNKASAWLMIKRLREEKSGNHLPKENELDALLSIIHEKAYEKSGTFFVQDAQRYLVSLHKAHRLVIVTNVDTMTVKAKLRFLLRGTGIEADEIALFGSARKYRLDHGWETVPPSTNFPGLNRPVYLRRRDYYNVLKSIGLTKLALVVGDIGELDLILPDALGIPTALLTSNRTPRWELDYWSNHSNGFSSSALEEIVDKIFQL